MVAIDDLVRSLMLVAFSLIEIGLVPMTCAGAEYVAPDLVRFFSSPSPEPILQRTPEFVGSFATATVNACDPPPPMLTADGLTASTLIASSGRRIAADFAGSVLLVAIKTAAAALTGNGAT